ncbi:MAG: FAD-binding domain-containing protein [Planctomycetota bacterium]
MTARGVDVVWFKRDLRVSDHPALCAALRNAVSRGHQLLCLYVHEPSLTTSAEFDPRHQRFIAESLSELDTNLRQRGARLTQRTGEWPEVLFDLDRELEGHGGVSSLWSHEETGLEVTYARDRRVARAMRERGLPWTELPQRGVFRALRQRDGWAGRWRRRTERDPLPAPDSIPGVDPAGACFDHGSTPEAATLGLALAPERDQQAGGEAAALVTLKSFLTERGEHYQRAMSSPLEGATACSRVSAHLAWGTLSSTQALRLAHLARERHRQLRSEGAARWRGSIEAFTSRLAWRDHFTQKLESEPAIEFRNMNRAFDGMREDDFDDARFEAFTRGETGFPFVDACVRSLEATGWLNFRMRAMLVSFLAWDLWLHWRRPAVWMAARFLDFEPGIHFAQFQMQSGTAGINTTRIYNPMKQQRDQDPDGVFVRRWVPEIAALDDEFLAEPWKTPPLTQRMAGCVIGADYPEPIVDHAAAIREAKRRLSVVKRHPQTRAMSRDVFERHGSRRGPRGRAS